MSHPYSEETQRILNHFVATLGEDERTDPGLLSELRRMMADGALESPARIRRTIAARKQALDAHWQGDRWVEVPADKAGGLVEAVRQLTVLFECVTCGQLLNYDGEREVYVCAECSGEEDLPSRVPAYWYVG
jgi:DNA-directed RNA polymerase subunit RPC12/RpoP